MEKMRDAQFSPQLEDFYECVRNPLLQTFCESVKEIYQVKETISFSKCSMEYGWNIRFKKGGKSLCVIYPREGYFTVLVVVGRKEKETVEEALPSYSKTIQAVYRNTTEGNNQKWLMIDLEDQDQVYEDVFSLLAIRRNTK